ncbi:2-dehydropantoate 2-reductase [Streptomyces sp. A7024]|uniref:2-dehydropantoate 2-reductase n=1 Tax=Streptomyces coryli TaxID=1128680 RepID=A0A6G4UE37_9ACTN|nr:2-dehydropantoate 2-reductase [Streptomyces coryli]NGN69647.1 2-dehydropantoate 2-reductase [Streptomyces coryli]
MTSTIAVLGPGGVGGLLAGLLARAGHRVICLASDTTASAIRERGITVRSGHFGDFTAAVEADTELREPVDALFVTVKATAMPEALDRAPAAALGDGLVVPLLNGVEHMDMLRERYDPAQVTGAVIRVESTRTAPGEIEHGSPFCDLDLASATAPRERLEQLAGLLKDAGASATVHDDEATILWAKLAFLATAALLTTQHAATVGDVRTTHADEMRALVSEAVATGRACGADVTAEPVLRLFERMPYDTKSSMQRDAEAGRPLELDAIGGALLRAADRRGVPVPVAKRLVSSLRERHH